MARQTPNTGANVMFERNPGPSRQSAPLPRPEAAPDLTPANPRSLQQAALPLNAPSPDLLPRDPSIDPFPRAQQVSPSSDAGKGGDAGVTIWVRTPQGKFLEYERHQLDGDPIPGKQIQVHGSDGLHFVVGFGEDFPRISDPLVQSARADAARYAKPDVSNEKLQNIVNQLYHGAEMADPRQREYRGCHQVGGVAHGPSGRSCAFTRPACAAPWRYQST